MSLTKVTYSMISGAAINPLDYGAVGDGLTDDTSAIQTAINTGKSIVFSEGTYLANNLTQSTNNQRFYGLGNVVIKKNGNGVLLTSSGRAVMFEGIKFDGNVAFTGDCVKTTGDNCVFTNCSVWTKNGFALLAEGNGNRILGTSDIYYSDDAAGYAICLGNTSTFSNYNQIVGINTSTSVGAILLRKANGSVTGCQLGAINTNTGGMYISNCRIIGNIDILSNFTEINNCTIAGNVTIGDGINPISGIGFGSNVFMQAGSTFTLNNRVAESSICTAQLINVTVVDNLTGTVNDVNNYIYSRAKSYVPTWTADVSNPSIGNGSLSGSYIRTGKTVLVTIDLSIGSTTTTGTGPWRFTLPTTAKNKNTGTAVMVKAGAESYVGAISALDGQNYMTISPNALTGNVGASIPFVWATNDFGRFTVQYETV